MNKWFKRVNRVADNIKRREIAKQEKYLKIAKRFLDKASLNSSKEPDREHDETKG